MVRLARDGRMWRIGTEAEVAWITSGAAAGLVIVFATVDAARGAKGVTAFLVEPDFPGFSVGKKEKKMGIRGSQTVELNLDDLRVPAANRLGEEGGGFRIALETLDGGRIGEPVAGRKRVRGVL